MKNNVNEIFNLIHQLQYEDGQVNLDKVMNIESMINGLSLPEKKELLCRIGELLSSDNICLSWFCEGTDGPTLAVVTQEKGAAYTERNGNAVRNRKPLPPGSAACALRVEEDRVYVWWRGTYGYLRREDVELAVPQAGPDIGK